MILTFKNNKGELMGIEGKMTIKQLVEMGIRDFRFYKDGEPLADNWWINIGQSQAKPKLTKTPRS